MAIPEGYAVAPTTTDHMVKIAVPVPGRENPILIEAPKLAWIPPHEVDAYQDWMKPFIEAEAEVIQWHTDNDDLEESKRSEFPKSAEDLVAGLTIRETKVRWLKPYLTAVDYKLLATSKKIPEKTIDWVVDQLKASSDDVTPGEYSASADS
ncbi:hypothetical protein ACPXB3_21395 [Gordonia sp. DT219]|uniref:hypothetical protein n=1 Tax=Gordonia sp. DT219 TaxID=3416658 RepID=UPI003CEFCE45